MIHGAQPFHRRDMVKKLDMRVALDPSLYPAHSRGIRTPRDGAQRTDVRLVFGFDLSKEEQ